MLNVNVRIFSICNDRLGMKYAKQHAKLNFSLKNLLQNRYRKVTLAIHSGYLISFLELLVSAHRANILSQKMYMS